MSKYKLVPVEPTQEMIDAYESELNHSHCPGSALEAAIQHAPEADQELVNKCCDCDDGGLLVRIDGKPISGDFCHCEAGQKKRAAEQPAPSTTHSLPAAFIKWLEAFIELSNSAGINDHEECWSWPAPPSDPHFFDNYPKLTTGVMRELHKHQLQVAQKTVPTDEFYIEFETLRKALCMMGIVAPESDGELGVRMQSYAKQVIRAVARKYPQPAPDAAVLAEALEEIARWSERWASADHPVATVARKALEDFRQQGG